MSGWCQQFPSHSIGTVTFGPDGALYASAGEGASFNYADYGQTNNPCGDPPSPAGTDLAPPTAQGGALRSQSVRRPAGQPVSLDGTIIRVDPDTGAGLPGNPFAASADHERPPHHRVRPAQPVPLRRPARDATAVGRAMSGWNTWEEINRIADVDDGVAENFGWPCYEGTGRQGGYDGADLNSCESLYAVRTDRALLHVQPQRQGRPGRLVPDRELLGERGCLRERFQLPVRLRRRAVLRRRLARLRLGDEAGRAVSIPARAR